MIWRTVASLWTVGRKATVHHTDKPPKFPHFIFSLLYNFTQHVTIITKQKWCVCCLRSNFDVCCVFCSLLVQSNFTLEWNDHAANPLTNPRSGCSCFWIFTFLRRKTIKQQTRECTERRRIKLLLLFVLKVSDYSMEIATFSFLFLVMNLFFFAVLNYMHLSYLSFIDIEISYEHTFTWRAVVCWISLDLISVLPCRGIRLNLLRIDHMMLWLD